MSPFLTELHEKLIDPYANNGAGLWQLTEDFRVWSGRLGREVVVREGFIHDHASVPRIIGLYAAYGNRYHRPAVVHDALCEETTIPRKQIDLVFLDLMRAQNADEIEARRRQGDHEHLLEARAEALESRASAMYAGVSLYTMSGFWRDPAVPSGFGLDA